MQTNSEISELLNKNLQIVKVLENKAKLFGRGMLVLSLLDCIFGVLAIFCTTLTLTAFFASATSLTAITICGRVIQISKLQQLEKSLKTLNFISIAWFVNKYSKYLKKGEKKVKTTKLSGIQIASIIGALAGVTFAVISAFVPQVVICGDMIYNTLIATGIEGVCAFAGTFKGYKKMTDEEIAKLKSKQEEKEQIAKEKQIKKAKAELEHIEQLKKIVEEAAENEAKAKLNEEENI